MQHSQWIRHQKLCVALDAHAFNDTASLSRVLRLAPGLRPSSPPRIHGPTRPTGICFSSQVPLPLCCNLYQTTRLPHFLIIIRVEMDSSVPLTLEQAAAAGFLPASHWQKQAVNPNFLPPCVMFRVSPADQYPSLLQLEQEETTGDYLDSLVRPARPARAGTESLTATIYEYRSVHGRTYPAEVGNSEAWEPNDQRHVEAMEIL